MGAAVPKQLSPLERTLRFVLRDLCVEWGYCLPPAEVRRIASSSRITAEQFAEAVLCAEGQPPGQHSDLVRRLSAFFVARVGASALPEARPEVEQHGASSGDDDGPR